MLSKTSRYILVVSLLMLVIAACSDVSSALGQRYRGKTLDVVIMGIERANQVAFPVTYRTGGVKTPSRCDPADPNDSALDQPLTEETKHWEITPSSSELELVLLKLKVENHTATNAVVNIDERAAELRDFVQGKYFPINVNDTMVEVGEPENPYDERSMVFLWNKLSPTGEGRAVELRRGCGLEGWLLFEAPIDTKFREFKWVAGDSLTIDF
ncbi:MAG: hypothetical protein FI692_03415 [SAR202 cluster bacterium]|nr:hypothetical protein [Chloroflexota bacterium]MQG80813.1 hypothetical protein [SAR202 cluster bacterium]